MIKKTGFFSFLLLFLLIQVGCSAPPNITRVIEVIDGDTIKIEGGYTVRYIGIDTPETYPVPEDYGVEALTLNRKLVEGKTVKLETDISETDKYGRLLRYVFVDDVFINAELVKAGLAEARAYPPDTKYYDYLENLEEEARRDGKGMWANR